MRMNKRIIMPERFCGDCRYFEQQYYGNDEMEGWCRRYAPRFQAIRCEESPFPIVQGYDWCAELEGRED